jgi:hypothetical protein
MRTLKYIFTCKRRLNSNVQEEASGIRWHCRVGKRFVVGKGVNRSSICTDIAYQVTMPPGPKFKK